MSADSSQLEAAAKIKKEQPTSPTLPAGCDVQQQQQQQQQPVRLQQRSASAQFPTPSSLANGHFHSRDLLQDVLKGSKFNNLSHLTPAAKHEAIRLMIEDSISEESRYRAQEIFSQIEKMKVEEKLLLYLKLSVSLTNPNGTVDPLRQPLNPLGNRYEIHQTIMWIKTHLEEDPDVSLPKQDVYEEYNMFCAKNSMKPLSTADFGKVMKQVYPRVRPRRLGTRGNSRYCYSGMRKRIKLNPPTLPSTNDDEDFDEEMLGAAATLIREWAESLLDVKFPTLCSLGKYLVNNLCVDNRSLAAVCILSASGETQSVTNKGTSPGLPATPIPGKIIKLREATLQLQRKLQQRELTRDQKDQHVNSVMPVDNKEKTVDQNVENIGVGGKKGKRGKATNTNHLVQGTNNALSKANNAPVSSAVTSTGRQKKVLKSNNQPCSGTFALQSNCDNLVVQSIQADKQISSTPPRLVRSNSAQSPREIKPRNTRKRAGSSAAAASVTTASMTTESSPEKQLKLADMLDSAARSAPRLSSTPIHHHLQQQQQQHSTKTSVILDSNPKAAKSNKTSGEPLLAATLVNQPPKSCDKDSFLCSKSYSESNGHAPNSVSKPSQTLNKEQMQLLSDSNSSHAFKHKLGNIDSDTLNDYLHNGNNSQEQEEELMQYFQPSNSSSSDMELSNVASEAETSSRQDQVSQLRIILQENLQDSVLGGSKPRLQSAPVDKQQALQKHSLILPTLLSAHSNSVNTRRRVSFETSAVEYSQDSGNGTSTAGSSCSTSNTVPQSPNTRRRIFNFTPISPGPHSPINGRASKSNSANASPFVSPRNTPVPRSRSNLQGNCRTRNAQKTLSRSISCNVPCSSVRSDTFIVPISAPELNGGNRHSNSPLAPMAINKASQATQPSTHSPLPEAPSKAQTLPCTPLLSDLGHQEDQLLINYPSQENLQEIKNVYSQKSQPTDQGISDLLQSKCQQQYVKDRLFYRSQSVPLHRMVNPALLSPISVTQQMTPTFHSYSFNASANSSIAPTPVPSEFNDFSSISESYDNSKYLLDVDPLVSSTDQDFFYADKVHANLDKLFDMLNEAEPETILSDDGPVGKDQTIDSNSLIESLAHANLSDSILLEHGSSILDSWTNENGLSSGSSSGTGLIAAAPKLIHSRSYPNTPLPLPNPSSSSSSLAIQYPDDSNGSRSYPTTPLHNLHQQQQQQQHDAYTESNEPMLFNSTLNAHSLGLPNHRSSTEVSGNGSTSVECNVTDFLEQAPNDGSDDLGSLGNFDGLQDVAALSPLFNEVVEPNH